MIQGKRAEALSTAATRLLEQPTRLMGSAPTEGAGGAVPP